MAWYRTGTVAVTSGSKNVTGTGTFWVNNAQAGDEFEGPDGKRYEVDVVGGNGAMTIVEDYAGTTVASGGAYKIIPTQGRVRDLTAAVLQVINDYGAVESALTVDAGRLGLGKTPNASAKLDVAGQVWVDAPSGDATVRLLTSGAEKGKLAVTSAGRVYIESNGAAVMSWLNGNVGIGTDTPSAALTVAGNLLLSTRGATTGAQWPDFRLYNTAGNSLVIDDYTNVFFAITSSGNIGIGTASPTTFGAGYSALSIDGSTCGVLDLMQAGASAFRLFCFPTEARLQVMLNVPMKFYTNNVIRGQFKATGQLNLEPLASDPSGSAGDLYFNGTTSKFRGHTGSGWVDLH